MKRLLIWAVLGLSLFLSARPVRADVIHWHYDFSRSPDFLSADPEGPGSAGTGSINFFSALSGSAQNTSDIVAVNMATSSSAPDVQGNPDHYSSTKYTLTMVLTDDASGQSATLGFGGAISGTVTVNSANLSNVFDAPTTFDRTLGSNHYVVTVGPFTPPGKPGAQNFGAIGVHVEVTSGEGGGGGGTVEKVPEPSTLLLAGLGLAGAGLAFRPRARNHLIAGAA